MAAVKARKKPEPEQARKSELTRKKNEAVQQPAAEPGKRGRPRVSSASGDELGAAEVARRVADGLKHFRKIRGLSLDDLATRSGPVGAGIGRRYQKQEQRVRKDQAAQERLANDFRINPLYQ